MTSAYQLAGREMCDGKKAWAGWVHEETQDKLKSQLNSKVGGGEATGGV